MHKLSMGHLLRRQSYIGTSGSGTFSNRMDAKHCMHRIVRTGQVLIRRAPWAAAHTFKSVGRGKRCMCLFGGNADGASPDQARTLGSGTYSSASRSNSVAYASQRPTRLTAPLLASM